MEKIPYRTFLEEKEFPKYWYNIIADLKEPLEPFLNPDGSEVTKEQLKKLFASTLVEHEFSKERYIEIPKEVSDIYRTFRSTPLVRAYRLEKALGTSAHLYYKYEGLNPSGSHKLNSAIPQVYYNKLDGIKKLTTETGAGQWGTALAAACAFFDMDCDVYMVKVSGQQKPQRRQLIETYGAKTYLSPSDRTENGRAILKKDPDNGGNLGIAISEAVEAAIKENAHYALGSVLNHVILHQTIIGQEAKLQFEKVGEYPDMVISCVGGGSNFGGIAFPFIGDMLRGEKKGTEFVAVEPSACPTITKGKYAYDYGDTAHLTPIMLQYTLGNSFMPPKIHSGGLRYHGMNTIVSKLCHEKIVDAVSVSQREVFESALFFTKTEGILPAPESGHSIAEAIKRAKQVKPGEKKVILFNVTGHGNFDMAAYENFQSGKLLDAVYTDEMLEKGFKSIPDIEANKGRL